MRMAENKAKKSIARQVFSYLDTHPYARQAIVMGIANLSSLSRRVKEELALPAKAGVRTVSRTAAIVQEVGRGLSTGGQTVS